MTQTRDASLQDVVHDRQVVAQTKSKSVQLHRILIVPMARALCFGLGAWFAAGANLRVSNSNRDFWDPSFCPPQNVDPKSSPPEISGATVHPERQALLAKLQEQTDLTWTPGIVERFASDAPGSSKIYGVKGNVSQVKKWAKNA